MLKFSVGMRCLYNVHPMRFNNIVTVKLLNACSASTEYRFNLSTLKFFLLGFLAGETCVN